MKQKPSLGQSPRAGHSLADGLIASYMANAGSGSWIRDDTGNGNDGTFQGTTSWAVGAEGRSLLLNGSADWVDVPDILGITANSIVIGGTPATTTGSGLAFGGRENTRIYLGHNDTAFYARLANQGDFGSGTITAGQYYQMVLAWSGVNGAAYLNGQPAGSTGAVSWPGTPDKQNIGSYHEGLDSFWDGEIHYCHLYDRMITADEVRALYFDPFAMYRHEPIWRLLPSEVGAPGYYYRYLTGLYGEA